MLLYSSKPTLLTSILSQKRINRDKVLEIRATTLEKSFNKQALSHRIDFKACLI